MKLNLDSLDELLRTEIYDWLKSLNDKTKKIIPVDQEDVLILRVRLVNRIKTLIEGK